MVLRRMVPALLTALLIAPAAWSTTPPPHSLAAQQEAQRLAELPPVAQRGTRLDHSGRKVKGRASYYARHFANRKMADGHRFNANAATAASRTLPLGTTAKVINLQNGRSATVTIADRGPSFGGRVVDVTPRVADQLDMRKRGVASVIVAPIAVPQPDGAVKLGAGAVDVSQKELEAAIQETAAIIR